MEENKKVKEPVHIEDISGEKIRKKIQEELVKAKGVNEKLKLKVWKSQFESMGTRKEILLMAELHPDIELDIVGLERGPVGYHEVYDELKKRGFSDADRNEIFATIYNLKALESAGMYAMLIGFDSTELVHTGVPKGWCETNYSIEILDILKQLDMIEEVSHLNASNLNVKNADEGIRLTDQGNIIVKGYFSEELWIEEVENRLRVFLEKSSKPLYYSLLHQETVTETKNFCDINNRYLRTFNEGHFDHNSLVQKVFDNDDIVKETNDFWELLYDLNIAVTGPKVERFIEYGGPEVAGRRAKYVSENVGENIKYIPLFVSKKIFSMIESLISRDALVPRLLMYLNRNDAKTWKKYPEMGLNDYGMTEGKNLSDLKNMIKYLHEQGIASSWVDSDIPYTLNYSKFRPHVRKYLIGEIEIDIGEKID